MYLHIGMSMYLRTNKVVGIFPISLIQTNALSQAFLSRVKIIAEHVPRDEAKACILTTTNDLYLSNVNCRTLRRRWKAQER